MATGARNTNGPCRSVSSATRSSGPYTRPSTATSMARSRRSPKKTCPRRTRNRRAGGDASQKPLNYQRFSEASPTQRLLQLLHHIDDLLAVVLGGNLVVLERDLAVLADHERPALDAHALLEGLL